jgi:hypothetical protein
MGTNQSYAARRAAIMADPAASYWLKTAIDQLARRDPLDAERDVDELYALMMKRCEEARI